jgi:hypothetical protein
VVCLDRVVRVLLNDVQGGGNQFVEHARAGMLQRIGGLAVEQGCYLFGLSDTG